MSWLDELLKQTADESEAPERYFWWSGLTAISAAVRKNVWFNKFKYKVYPNIYVGLISPESGGKKGIPILVCKTLLQEAGVARIISGRNSVQGIIKELGGQDTLESGLVIGDAHATLIAGELKSFLTKDPDTMGILIDLYNTHENDRGWVYNLKNSDKIKLKSPCLTFLFGSNEMMLSQVINAADTEGGLIARTMLVKEGKTGKINPLIDPPENELNYPKLAKRLIDISQLKGEFKWATSDAKELYREWHREWETTEHSDRTGTANRMNDHVLKIAMLISLSNKNELEFDYNDIASAIDKCEECYPAAERLVSSYEPSNGDRPNAGKFVLEGFIALKYETTKTNLLRWLHKHQVSAHSADIAIDQLIAMGWVSRMLVGGSGHTNDKMILVVTEEGHKAFGKEFEKQTRTKKRAN